MHVALGGNVITHRHIISYPRNPSSRLTAKPQLVPLVSIPGLVRTGNYYPEWSKVLAFVNRRQRKSNRYQPITGAMA